MRELDHPNIVPLVYFFFTKADTSPVSSALLHVDPERASSLLMLIRFFILFFFQKTAVELNLVMEYIPSSLSTYVTDRLKRGHMTSVLEAKVGFTFIAFFITLCIHL